MKVSVLSILLALGALVLAQESARGNSNHGRNLHWRGHWHMPQMNITAPKRGNTTFSQLIDHNNPHLGTFEQWFVYVFQHTR